MPRRCEFHLVGLENIETPSTSSVWPSDYRKDFQMTQIDDHASCGTQAPVQSEKKMAAGLI